MKLCCVASGWERFASGIGLNDNPNAPIGHIFRARNDCPATWFVHRRIMETARMLNWGSTQGSPASGVAIRRDVAGLPFVTPQTPGTRLAYYPMLGRMYGHGFEEWADGLGGGFDWGLPSGNNASFIAQCPIRHKHRRGTAASFLTLIPDPCNLTPN